MNECNFTDECVNILCFDDCDNLTVKNNYQFTIPYVFDDLIPNYCPTPDVINGKKIQLIDLSYNGTQIIGETFATPLNNAPFNNCRLELKFSTLDCFIQSPPIFGGFVEVWGSEVLPCPWNDTKIPSHCDNVYLNCLNGDIYQPVCLGSASVTNTQTNHTIIFDTNNIPIDIKYLIFVFKEGGCVELDNFSLVPDCAVEAGFTYLDDICNEIAFTPNAAGSRLTHTWDFGDGSSNSTASNPTHSYATNGTFNVIHTVVDNCGNSHSETIAVTVICCEPNKEQIVVDGSHGGVLLSALGGVFVNPGITGVDIFLRGTLTIDVSGKTFTSCTWTCGPGSEIVIQSNKVLTITGNSFLSCEKMWKGISNDGRLIINNSSIKDAQYAVKMNDLSTLSCSSNTFDKCYIGIYSAPLGTLALKTISSYIALNKFDCNGLLKPAYLGQVDYPSGFGNPDVPERITFAGVALYNVAQSLIGLYSVGGNVFNGIRNGIITFRGSSGTSANIVKNLKGSYFHPTFPNLQSGVGIYNLSTLTNIHTYNNMDDASNGILVHDSRNGYIYVQNNNIKNLELPLPYKSVGIDVVSSTNSNIVISFDTIESRQGLILSAVTPTTFTADHIEYESQLYNPSTFQTGFLFSSFIGNTFCKVSDNTINLKSKFTYGASIVSSNDITLENNKYLNNNYQGQGLQFVNNSHSIYFNHNLFSNVTNSGFATNSQGIDVMLSPNTSYCCNEVKNASSGIFFSATSTGTTLRANTFDGIVNDGIRLGDAYIGTQSHLGNIWSGVNSTGSIYSTVGNEPFIAAGSRFKVNTALNADYQPDIILGVIPTDWFINEPGADEVCVEIEDCGEKPGFKDDDLQIRSCDIEALSDFIQIAQGITLEGYYSEQNKWSAQSQLYQMLAENKIANWQECEILNNFYNNSEVYREYYELESKVRDLKRPEQTQFDVINVNKEIIKSSLDQLVELYTMHPDTATIYPYQDQVNEINEILKIHSTSTYSIEEEVNIAANQKSNQNLDIINNLP